MPRRAPGREPAVFHRVYLAVLGTTALCCAAAAGLYAFLFADGVWMFLIRPPVLILPVVLTLLGIGGIIALRTAAPIALPLVRLARLLAQRVPGHAVRTLRPGTEETAEVLDALAALDTTPDLLLLHVDRHLNILAMNDAARARLVPPDGGTILSLRSLLDPDDDTTRALREDCASGLPPAGQRLVLRLADGMCDATVSGLTVPGGCLLALQCCDSAEISQG
jgi:hypothetical protein